MCFASNFQIKRYHSFKVKHANIYDNLLPTSVTTIFHHDILVAFKCRDQLGRRIILLELGSEYNMLR